MGKKLINKFYEWLFQNGIRKQILSIVVVALLVPTLTIGAFLSSVLFKSTYESAQDQMWSDNLRVRSLLLDCFLDVNAISDDLISDKVLQDLLQSDLSDQENISFVLNSYPRLKNYHDTKAFISEIAVYTTNPTIVDARYIKQVTPQIREAYISRLRYGADIIWCENPETKELTQVRYIPLLHSRDTAILTIGISNNYLKNRIRNNNLYTCLHINQAPIFFSTTRSDQGSEIFLPIDYADSAYSDQGLYEYHEKKAFGCVNSLLIPKSTDTIYISTLDFSLLGTLKKLLLLSSLIIIFSFAVALWGIIFYTKALSRRIEILRSATHQASNGNYNIMDSFEGKDELSETFRDIKHMIQNVQETEAEIYEEQLRKEKYENNQREMEFKLLTSQINPHFIYNTLEMIRMLALSNKDYQVSATVSMLGKCLHYVLENTISTKASIEQELNHIVNYLQIQKMRFEDRFDYRITLPESFDATSYEILPLLLQPLVENVFTHGMEGLDHKCMIEISLSLEEGDTMAISVSDNGVGMTDEALQTLNQNLSSPMLESQRSIALLNIAKRIRLFYGEKYYLKVLHNHPQGTHVQLSIPLIPYE
ncbi:MAG: histidine kinase [Lachnospiraceae bacterium]|nr:histidine kinase [Lachnospiraceae bacterium]